MRVEKKDDLLSHAKITVTNKMLDHAMTNELKNERM
jgi:hypothetical protein